MPDLIRQHALQMYTVALIEATCFQIRTIRRGLGSPPETVSRHGCRRPSGHMDVLVACLGRSAQLPANPQSNPERPVPTESRATGTFP